MDNNRLQQIYDDAGRPGVSAFRFAVRRAGLQISEAEAKALTNKTSLSDIHSELLHFTNTYIITLGDKGSICFDGSDIIQIPAINVKAIDTNGAGDTFAGIFLSENIC